MNSMSLNIQGIPQNLNDQLVAEYLEVKKRYSMNDWGPGQLKGGRFAECCIRIFQHLLGIPITPFGTDIPNVEKTRIINLMTNNSVIDEHIRQKVTSATRLLLDFRNNRDVAHLGGFDANSMDSYFVMSNVTWILCELIRVYGGFSMTDAQKIVTSLSVKEYPAIMEFGGDVFLTKHNLTAKQEVLVLLYKFSSLGYEFLFSKTKDRNSARFKRTLRDMVKGKFIGQKDGMYFIMPRGLQLVEKTSLLSYIT